MSVKSSLALRGEARESDPDAYGEVHSEPGVAQGQKHAKPILTKKPGVSHPPDLMGRGRPRLPDLT